MKSFLIFVIQAYEEALEDGHLRDVVTLELISKDDKSAVKKAKKMIKRKFYRVSQIIEKEIC